MRHERPGHSLQATALVNEAYLRLIDIRHVQWQDRAHFFAMSARVMRRILVDSARARGSEKRGEAMSRRCRSTRRSSCQRSPGRISSALDEALQAIEKVPPAEKSGGGTPILRGA